MVGDGALTGGMCWEALNNIAAADRPVIVVVNDNGRSYSPTVGGLAKHLAGLRLRPGYERVLSSIRERLDKTPVVGPPLFDALHGMKRGIKDLLQPQSMFEDLGLKYLGPIDGHDLEELENAFRLARNFDGPVHRAHLHPQGLRLRPGRERRRRPDAPVRRLRPRHRPARPVAGRSWTSVFSDEMVRVGEQRDDVVAITAAMCDPTGLGPFSKAVPRSLLRRRHRRAARHDLGGRAWPWAACTRSSPCTPRSSTAPSTSC